MDVPMELSRIIISEHGGEQFIFLREKGGERTFPIVIGIAEALAIDRRLKGTPTPRPMTHDLLASVIDALGGEVEKVVVNDLRHLSGDSGQTFFATIHIRQNGEVIEIDSRPSDAIALGVAMQTPIFVSQRVLDAALKEQPSLEAKIGLLRQRLDMLRERIEEMTDDLKNEEFVEGMTPDTLEEYRAELAQHQAEYDAIERVLKKVT